MFMEPNLFFLSALTTTLLRNLRCETLFPVPSGNFSFNAVRTHKEPLLLTGKRYFFRTVAPSQPALRAMEFLHLLPLGTRALGTHTSAICTESIMSLCIRWVLQGLYGTYLDVQLYHPPHTSIPCL